MGISVASWTSQLVKAIEESDWDAVAQLDARTKQSFTDGRDWVGLEGFYSEALATILDEDMAEQVRVKNVRNFQSVVEATLRDAVQRASCDARIKAIYFEYFFDGGDASDGNAFLCTEYSKGSDAWAAEFDPESVVEGPSVLDYLNYDPDLEFEEGATAVADAYVDAHLLAAWGRAVESLGAQVMPMGFARHDRAVITLQPS